MDPHNLVRMANRIGEFFDSFPDHEEALDGIAQHIARFWEPRMRRAIFAALDGPDGAALAPIVAEALRARRSIVAPAVAIPLPIPPQGESEA